MKEARERPSEDKAGWKDGKVSLLEWQLRADLIAPFEPEIEKTLEPSGAPAPEFNLGILVFGGRVFPLIPILHHAGLEFLEHPRRVGHAQGNLAIVGLDGDPIRGEQRVAKHALPVRDFENGGALRIGHLLAVDEDCRFF